MIIIKQSAVTENINRLLAFVVGAGGGSLKFLISNPDYPVSLLQAVITALLCGFAGVMGKELYGWCKQKVKRYVGKD
jgi:hypothetical protein